MREVFKKFLASLMVYTLLCAPIIAQVNQGTSPLSIKKGGTNCSTASGTCLDNITGFGTTGFLKRIGAGLYSFVTGRTVLTAPTTFNVGPSGSDVAGCGLTAGSGACATRNFLWTSLQQNYDLACQAITISIAAATYADGFPGNGDIPGDCYFGQITFVGDTTTPSNVTIKPAAGANYPFEAQNGAKYFIKGFKLDGTNTGSSIAGLVTPTWGSQIGITGNMTFGCSPGSIDIQPGHGTYVFISSSYTIDKTGCGSSTNHIQGDPTHLVQVATSITITITGSPTYTQAFVSNNHGDENLCNINFSASISAPTPFFIQGGGQIETCVGTGTAATQHPGYIPTTAGTFTFTGTLTAGSNQITGVSAGNITSLQSLIGNQNGLLVVCTDCASGTFPPSMTVARQADISGTTVTLAFPGTQISATGAHTFLAGGLIIEGGLYYGSSGHASIPPVP